MVSGVSTPGGTELVPSGVTSPSPGVAAPAASAASAPAGSPSSDSSAGGGTVTSAYSYYQGEVRAYDTAEVDAVAYTLKILIKNEKKNRGL